MNLEEFGEIRRWIVLVEMGRGGTGRSFATERISLLFFSDIVQEISDA